MPASPSILNLYEGKGIVSVKLAGESVYRDVGNVPSFTWTPEVETRDHFSSRTGTRVKDRTVTTLKGGQIAMVFEEFTPENLALAMLGNISTNSDGDPEIDILANDGIEGAAIKFTGTNDIGPKLEFEFYAVSIIPNSEIQAIFDDWGSFTLAGETLADSTTGLFGRCAILSEEATA